MKVYKNTIALGKRAQELREEGLSLANVVTRINNEGLLKKRANVRRSTQTDPNWTASDIANALEVFRTVHPDGNGSEPPSDPSLTTFAIAEEIITSNLSNAVKAWAMEKLYAE